MPTSVLILLPMGAVLAAVCFAVFFKVARNVQREYRTGKQLYRNDFQLDFSWPWSQQMGWTDAQNEDRSPKR